MKKQRFAIILTILLLILTAFAVLPVGALSPDARVVDLGDMLTDVEEARLSEAVAEAEKTCHVTLRLIYWDDAKDSRSEYWGEDYMREIGRSFSSDTILLIVSKYNGIHYYDLYLYGKPARRLGQSKVDAILDDRDVYNNLKSGNLPDGSLAFVREIEERYDGTVRYVFTSVLPVTFLISLVVTLIVALVIVGRYRSKKKAKNYPLNEFTKLQLTGQRDIFAGSTMTRTRISSGGSRGGGSRGGSGGGRGHAGGR